MTWMIELQVKDYVRNWSNQEIDTAFKGSLAHIKIKDLKCTINIDGNAAEELFYLIWEMLFLYDGYFYKPISLVIDGVRKDASKLVCVPFYDTDIKWYDSGLLGRAQRDLSPNVIAAYEKFRNCGIESSKMTKSVVNAFYYLHSEAYGRLNCNHQLSLLLNVADGLVINVYGDTHNVKTNLEYLFQKTVNLDKFKHGIDLLGIPSEQYKYNLTEERNMFDHYIYKKDSIAALSYNIKTQTKNFNTWYFIYFLELVIRIKILKLIGVSIEQDNIDYAANVIVDWIIYENELNEECSTTVYQMRQVERKLKRNAEM